MVLTIPRPADADTSYPFPDTGQTKCYDDSTEITCPNSGSSVPGRVPSAGSVQRQQALVVYNLGF